MKDELLISVIVPIYNVEAYLRKCLDNICEQTYRNLEIILVDDGSTDGSYRICEAFQQKDSRVVLLHKENGGLVSARKAGVAISKGQYISFVDGDDWISPDMYEMLAALLQENSFPDMIAFGHVEEHKHFHRPVRNNFPSGLYRVNEGVFQAKTAIMTDVFFQCKILPYIWDKLIRAELLMKQLPKVSSEIVIGEDAACVFSCIEMIETILIADCCPYHYRQREDSIMKSLKEQNHSNFQDIYRLLRPVVDAGQLHCYLFNILLIKGYTKIGSDMCLFPFEEIRANERIFLYGAGVFGKVLCNYIEQSSHLLLAGWADRNYKYYQELGYPVAPYKSVFTAEYDHIVIAIMDGMVCRAVKEKLVLEGIAPDKILYITRERIQRIPLPKWVTDGSELDVAGSTIKYDR